MGTGGVDKATNTYDLEPWQPCGTKPIPHYSHAKVFRKKGNPSPHCLQAFEYQASSRCFTHLFLRYYHTRVPMVSPNSSGGAEEIQETNQQERKEKNPSRSTQFHSLISMTGGPQSTCKLVAAGVWSIPFPADTGKESSVLYHKVNAFLGWLHDTLFLKEGSPVEPVTSTEPARRHCGPPWPEACGLPGGRLGPQPA